MMDGHGAPYIGFATNALRKRAGGHWGLGRWLIGVIALLSAAGAAVVLVGLRSPILNAPRSQGVAITTSARPERAATPTETRTTAAPVATPTPRRRPVHPRRPRVRDARDGERRPPARLAPVSRATRRVPGQPRRARLGALGPRPPRTVGHRRRAWPAPAPLRQLRALGQRRPAKPYPRRLRRPQCPRRQPAS
jgi:hypothetical protein